MFKNKLKQFSLAQLFYQNIKINKIKKNIKSNQINKKWLKIDYKTYPDNEIIYLPIPGLSDKTRYKKVISNRRSLRNSSSKLILEDISNLLYYSAGKQPHSKPLVGNRFYPSAGGRYPLEIYLLINNKRLTKVIYHYQVKNHYLEQLKTFQKLNLQDFFSQDWIARFPYLILITSVFKRTIGKYGDRGYNYVMIEAGHLGQNIYLTSTALGLGCCAIGGFVENKLNKLIGIDGKDESVIYVLAVGKIK